MQDASYRIDNLYRRLDNVQGALARHLDHEESMTPGGRQLLSRSQLLLDHARQVLEFRWQRTEAFGPGVREVTRRNLCEDFTAVVRELAASLLPALDGAVSHRVPVELEAALQRMADRAAGDWRPRVLLYASDALNYSIERHEDPFEALAPTLAAVPRTTREESLGPFLFLRVPEVERDTAMLHAIILGHELGHLRDWAEQISGVATTRIPLDWVDEAGKVKKEHIQDFVRYASVLHRWSAEIVADLLAAHLLGPASLLAFGELIGSLGGWSKDSPTHPAPDRRSAIVADTLRELGYGAIPELDTVLTHYELESANALTRRVVFEQDDPAYVGDKAWGRLLEALPELKRVCSEAISADEGLRVQDWPEVELARDDLLVGQPCGERAGSTDFSARADEVIMNGAWLARIGDLADFGRKLGLDASMPSDRSLIAAVLDGLVLKSFEIADMRREVEGS
jgi:hypothetical protein